MKSENMLLIGARAEILIKFNGDLESLAKKLSEDLHLPEFYFKSGMDSPHTITAMCESLGFETWLNSSDKIGEYIFEFCSMMCENVEPDNEHMNDISEWFVRILALSTKLEVKLEERK